ncbi:MAG TPA: diguanylate cyclase [Chiayiivirga sp.]|nr:diguanylate cyclase [Chiayiivirga sp.]
MRVLQCLLLLLGLMVVSDSRALDPDHHVSEYTVTGWTMEDGLPHNLVFALAQDDEGYLWIGSWEGAARFNGRSFTAFDERKLKDVPLIGVRTILHDQDGALLFGTAQHGIVRYAKGEWSKLEPTVEKSLRVVSMLRARDGSLWIGTDRSVLQLWPDGRLETVAEGELPYGVVFSLLERENGDMLIGSEHGLFEFHDGRLQALSQRLHLPATAVRAMVQRRNGNLIVAGNGGAFVITPSAQVQRIMERSVESLLEDRDDSLWLGISGGGLARWHQGRVQVIDEALGLHGRNSQALIEGRDGLLWVGTTNGLFRINDAPAFGLDKTRGLGDNYPRTILRHHDTMYVGHANGLDLWRGDVFEPIDLGGDVSVLALASARDGGLWIGTYDRGVLYLPDDERRVVSAKAIVEGLPSRHVRALAETADGSLWIGTTAGLVRRRADGSVQDVEDLPGHTGSFVRGISAARDGGLWISLANGLMHWSPDERMQRWVADENFPGIGAFDVLETENGDAWIGTDHGLLRLRAGKFSMYDRSRGLPNDTLLRVLRDRQGAMWLCSSRGAFRVDFAQFEELDRGTRDRLSVDTIDHASGMPSSQCNGASGPAGDLDAVGRIWFPTALGVAVIDPVAVVARSKVRVPILIEGVQANSKPLAPAQLHVLATSINRVVVRYVGLHLRDPLGVRYRYRMLGFENEWVDAGNDLDAVYTNLPPGVLRFEVQAAMAPVDWARAKDLPTAAIEFRRIPPFWRQPWFYVALPFIMLALSVMAFLWVSMRANKRQQQLALLVDARTQELSQANEALQQAWRDRESLLKQMAWQASHDALTDLPNRAACDARLRDAVFEAGASGRPLSVALLDIDHFKKINDNHGHAVGDAVLRHVARVVKKAMDDQGVDVARYGGEEFLFVLADRSLEDAARVMRVLLADLAASAVELAEGGSIACTASVGVAQWQVGQTASKIVLAADKRLYLAKRGGRNRVVDHDTPDPNTTT